MKHLEIEKVIGREIVDSRKSTVEAEVYLSDGSIGRGAAPSGASTGEFEALGCETATSRVSAERGVQESSPECEYRDCRGVKGGMDPADVYAVDKAMIEADGTKDKSSWARMRSWRFRSRTHGQQPMRMVSRCTVSSAVCLETVFRFR